MTPTAAPEAVKEAVNKTVTKINQQVKSRGTSVKNALRNAEREVLEGKRSGRKYRKPNLKTRYTASAPGEPPAKRFGSLRNHWTGGVETQAGSGKGIVVISYIESNTPYAGYLENGTKKIAPRPYVEKVKEKAQPEIEKIMRKDYS